MTFRAGPELVYSCSYDDKTYFERDHQMVTIARTEKGDHLELVTDRNPGSAVCYARTVHILDPPRSVPGVRPQPKNTVSPALLFTPRAELSLSGSVMRLAQDSLLLRLRSGEHKLIVVRPDTRFLSAGQPANPSSLRANTLVFVRGARDLYDRFEAYQVIWGDIFQPEP
jgi:hypothetical protein